VADITERKRAEWQLRESAENVRALSRRLFQVQEDERQHLARELHDEFGQTLATIALHLYAARKSVGDAARLELDECVELLKQAGDQVRDLAHQLRPTMLNPLDLTATLQALAEHHRQRTGLDVQFTANASHLALSQQIVVACFRLAQEALTNVLRHAKANHVWIEVIQSETTLELAIRDDGVGFDARIQDEIASRGCLGLLGMAERARLLGGELQVESQPGHGTRISALFRLDENGRCHE
jgi:two-component system sensor histidine kinase UhpB